MTQRSVPDRLHSVAIRVLRQVRAEDAASGLTAARLSALSVLVFGGDQTVSGLADAEQVSVPTMTKLLQGLERSGYVRRTRDPDDGRVVRVHAAAKGRRALENARARRVARLAELLAGLSAEDAKVLDSALSILERTLSAAAAQ